MMESTKQVVLEVLMGMKTTMLKMLDSKKAAALITSGILMLVVYAFGPMPDELKMDLADKIMKVVVVYLGAQGAADLGKEKAKAEAEKPVE